MNEVQNLANFHTCYLPYGLKFFHKGHPKYKLSYSLPISLIFVQLGLENFEKTVRAPPYLRESSLCAKVNFFKLKFFICQENFCYRLHEFVQIKIDYKYFKLFQSPNCVNPLHVFLKFNKGQISNTNSFLIPLDILIT